MRHVRVAIDLRLRQARRSVTFVGCDAALAPSASMSENGE